MPPRGTFKFEATGTGDLASSRANVEVLRRLWLDRTLISGENLGPGDEGDFDNGAWHVACHLVAAGGVRRAADGRLVWLEVSHDAARDEYYASATAMQNGRATTVPAESPEGRVLLQGSTLLGFVEGNSVGHISARGARDEAEAFNGWLRQDFDQPPDSRKDGGKVWEHWCTVRDIRESDSLASSVLTAYIALAAALGDRFMPTVARGRRDYGHPRQLCASVKAGLASEEAATWDTKPVVIPSAAEKLFLEARPADELAAAEQLAWDRPPRYYMFARRIGSWSPASEVRSDLRAFGRE
jgi:hypothetical protein